MDTNNNDIFDMSEEFEGIDFSGFLDEGKEDISISDEKMVEINKKLPSWSLEPPFNTLK